MIHAARTPRSSGSNSPRRVGEAGIASSMRSANAFHLADLDERLAKPGCNRRTWRARPGDDRCHHGYRRAQLRHRIDDAVTLPERVLWPVMHAEVAVGGRPFVRFTRMTLRSVRSLRHLYGLQRSPHQPKQLLETTDFRRSPRCRWSGRVGPGAVPPPHQRALRRPVARGPASRMLVYS